MRQRKGQFAYCNESSSWHDLKVRQIFDLAIVRIILLLMLTQTDIYLSHMQIENHSNYMVTAIHKHSKSQSAEETLCLNSSNRLLFVEREMSENWPKRTTFARCQRPQRIGRWCIYSRLSFRGHHTRGASHKSNNLKNSIRLYLHWPFSFFIFLRFESSSFPKMIGLRPIRMRAFTWSDGSHHIINAIYLSDFKCTSVVHFILRFRENYM